MNYTQISPRVVWMVKGTTYAMVDAEHRDKIELLPWNIDKATAVAAFCIWFIMLHDFSRSQSCVRSFRL